MSRFEINKFLSYVEGSDQAVTSYVEDPEGYVAGWESRREGSRLPVSNGGSLTDEERAALVTRDHAALYRLGAHPYVLWHFVEAIRVWTGETGWPEMTERYRADISGIEPPNIAT